MRSRYTLTGLALVASCSGPSADATKNAASTPGIDKPVSTTVQTASFDPATWRAPSDSEIPKDSLGVAIRRGLALLQHTPDSLPRDAPGRIACSNCHLDA